jgi:hypothetical protein
MFLGLDIGRDVLSNYGSNKTIRLGSVFPRLSGRVHPNLNPSIVTHVVTHPLSLVLVTPLYRDVLEGLISSAQNLVY